MLLSLLTAGARAQEVPAWFAPAAVAVSADGRILYAAGSRTAELLWMDTARGTVVREAELPDAATGLALDEAGGRLIVTYSGAGHRVVVFKESSGRVLGTLPAGVGVCAPVLARYEVPTTRVEHGWMHRSSSFRDDTA